MLATIRMTGAFCDTVSGPIRRLKTIGLSCRTFAKPGLDLSFTILTDRPIGFAEVSLRRDYVNGCDTSPVAFLEGIYVEEAFRRQGVAALLVEQVTRWAIDQGVSELASDADIANLSSHRTHAALGFEETERVVYFRRSLIPKR
ncbi:UNVERIFIED_ORG: GNAT superfamily N-acetyltransferase [Rhizobium sp. SORGH_AS260]|nr:GNAT superfamily N-acetyltransferase [Rhizobium sp. SORGH_AS_0260]